MIVTGKIPKRHLKAIHYFAEQLFTPQKRRHLYLHIKYRKKLDYLGLVTVDDYNVLGTPCEFTIEVLKNTEEEMLKTLAHEMTHCLQYARGELNEQMNMWRGKFIDSEKLKYDEQPWEQEAMQQELELYESFLATEA